MLRNRYSKITLCLVLCGALGAISCVNRNGSAADEPVSYDPETTYSLNPVTVVGGLENPWAVAFLPEGDILITERPGRLRLVRNGELRAEPVEGSPEVVARNQGGLLDIAVAPDFAESQLIYFSYSKAIANNQTTTALARGRWENDRINDLEDIFVADAPGSGRHYGSRIAFDHDGYLFLTVGERGALQPAQDLGNHIGTTVRLHTDGAVPEDNPFVDRDGAKPEIYSYGHRNQQGMAVHPQTGEVWQNEHGPRGGDEVNLVKAGANYGWPLANHADHYSGEPIPGYDEVEGIEPPLAFWTPAIAPSGMSFYTGDQFPAWKNNIFIGSLVATHLRRLVFDGTELIHQEVLLEDFGQRIRDVRTGPDGHLYVLTDESPGALVRLQPAGEEG